MISIATHAFAFACGVDVALVFFLLVVTAPRGPKGE